MNATAEPTEAAKPAFDDRQVAYCPLGEREEIVLTVAQVRNLLAVKTKSGAVPTARDIVQFMMLCQSQKLNPWTRDAYLIGYDSKNGPVFSLVVGIGALLKRAEASKDFDGIEQGVIYLAKGGTDPLYREGDFLMETETLLGGWCRVHRKDCSHPFYDALNLGVYDTNRSIWAKDKAGMIVKCAQASALRMAFPTQLGGLYVSEEFSRMYDQDNESRGTTGSMKSILDGRATNGEEAQPDSHRRAGHARAEDPPKDQATESGPTAPEFAPDGADEPAPDHADQREDADVAAEAAPSGPIMDWPPDSIRQAYAGGQKGMPDPADSGDQIRLAWHFGAENVPGVRMTGLGKLVQLVDAAQSRAEIDKVVALAFEDQALSPEAPIFLAEYGAERAAEVDPPAESS